jgi:hypothetical protein
MSTLTLEQLVQLNKEARAQGATPDLWALATAGEYKISVSEIIGLQNLALAQIIKEEQEAQAQQTVLEVSAANVAPQGQPQGPIADPLEATAVAPDLAEIKRALELLKSPGDIVELRAPGKRTWLGFYDSPDTLTVDAAEVSAMDGVENTYWTLQKLNPRPATNTAKVGGSGTTDEQVAAYQWLPTDFDPIRGNGDQKTCSTDAEKSAALELAKAVRAFLNEHGMPSILADSGNGYHVLVKIDLPASKRSLVESIVKGLAAKFTNANVSVDKSVFNESRIWKIYGTVARKGPNTIERPWRVARLVDVPELRIITESELQALRASLPTSSESKSHTTNGSHTRTANNRIPIGSRYSALMSEAGSLWSRGHSKESVVQSCIAWAAAHYEGVDESTIDGNRIRKRVEHLLDSYQQGQPRVPIDYVPGSIVASTGGFTQESLAAAQMAQAKQAGDATPNIPIVDDPSDHDSRFEMPGETFNTRVYEDASRRFTVYPDPGEGDLISLVAKKRVEGTPISVAYVREPLKAIVLHAIDGKVIHPAHQKLTMRGNCFNLGDSEGGKTTGLEYALHAANLIFTSCQIHLESLFRYKSEQTFLRSFTPEGTIKRDAQGKIKSGDPGHSSQFLHIKEGNLVAKSSDYFGAVFSQITNLYDQTEAGTESMTNGVFNAKTIKVSTVICFTPTDFVATFGGKGTIGGGGLNRWVHVNPPEDHSYDERDWEPVSDAEIQAMVNPLASKVFELRQHDPVVLIEEEGATKIRLETKAMLKKAGKAGKRLMEYFMREQVAQAATAADGRLVMTTQQAEYAKRWVDAQLECRRDCWPSDANNQIEGMEHAIRKRVNCHHVSETELRNACNYYREGSGGWFAFNAARSNMMASGAIKPTGKTRKGARTYCPGSCAAHLAIEEDSKPKKKA